MKTAIVTLSMGLALAGPALAQPHHFSYSGATAPPKWGVLNPEWRVCAEGKNQSPIDLRGFIDAKAPPLQLKYTTLGVSIINNGHAVQVDYAKGSQLSHDGTTFELKQFHFHAPSEHTLNGKSFPMEMHLVHADRDGNLAVVGVLMSEASADNPVIAKLWAQMPAKAGDQRKLDTKINAADLLPKSAAYYRYNGSLTTPPCSEGVRWYVMKQPVTVSKAQVEAFRKAVGFANNRPLQPINARVVLE
ncbi:MAG TPA: carbonic anhydrase family protein [Methylomirabilota bacterium]|jgi:carbonic anhydrase